MRRNQPLVDYFKAYRAYHNLRTSDPNTSESKITTRSQSIQIGPAQLTFHRTLRVPDNNTNSALPPSLGTFPLEPAGKYTEKLSGAMKARGGVLLPIMQREAMWIGFNGSVECAIKISIGGMLVPLIRMEMHHIIDNLYVQVSTHLPATRATEPLRHPIRRTTWPSPTSPGLTASAPSQARCANSSLCLSGRGIPWRSR